MSAIICITSALRDDWMTDIAAVAPLCHLLDLPTEIRVEIYRHLFDTAHLYLDSGLSLPGGPACGASICSCAFPRHIVNTCRQLRQEATPYLLAATTLQIYGTLNIAARLPPSYISTLSRASILNVRAFSRKSPNFDDFSSLRTLELHNVIIWCKYYNEAYLQSQEGDESMLQLALFNLNRLSFCLTQLCNNPSRPFKILLYCQYAVSCTSKETTIVS